MLVEKAAFLNLTIPEMTVLVGGMRAMDANAGGSPHGVFTDRPGTLSNDFFVNLIDMSTQWSVASTEGVYEGRDRVTGALRWTATPVDLIFGSNSELRAVAEHYAAADGEQAFLEDFVDAWTKVMTLDRFDLERLAARAEPDTARRSLGAGGPSPKRGNTVRRTDRRSFSVRRRATSRGGAGGLDPPARSAGMVPFARRTSAHPCAPPAVPARKQLYPTTRSRFSGSGLHPAALPVRRTRRGTRCARSMYRWCWRYAPRSGTGSTNRDGTCRTPP